jgi:hypothetical protein
MNAAGVWRSVEFDTGNRSGNLFRLSDCFHQIAPARFRAGVFNFNSSNFLALDAIRVGDIHRETAFRPPHSVHNIRRNFANYQAAETPGTESFVEKQPGLDGAEAEANEGAGPEGSGG